jgi:hypothetical protein
MPRLTVPAIGVALVAAMLFAGDAANRRRAVFPAAEDRLYLPRPRVLKALSLGHHELTADMVLMRAIVYFGAQFNQKGDFRWLENYLETIVRLDPYWKTPYRWAGTATMYHGRTITRQNVEASNHFLALGVKHFPDDWELPFMLGCNYLFELKSDDPVEKSELRRRGGEYIRHAALVGGAPAWVPLLAATIMREEGREEAAVRHLEEVYLTTRDERTREEVKNRLLAMKDRVAIERAERERRKLQDAWLRTAPYVPPDLFVLVGEPVDPRMDLETLAHDPVLAVDLDPLRSGEPEH